MLQATEWILFVFTAQVPRHASVPVIHPLSVLCKPSWKRSYLASMHRPFCRVSTCRSYKHSKSQLIWPAFEWVTEKAVTGVRVMPLFKQDSSTRRPRVWLSKHLPKRPKVHSCSSKGSSELSFVDHSYTFPSERVCGTFPIFSNPYFQPPAKVRGKRNV